jgi:ParB family chromosome partitioning protein
MNETIRRIPLDKLEPHPDNANRMSRANLAKLVRNIERTGHYEPLVVRPHPSQPTRFQIINGHHRFEALKRLGRDAAETLVWRVDDEQTDLLLATLNRLGGRDVLEKKLTVLRRLCRKKPLHDLAKLVGQTQGQLQRLMSQKLHTRKVRSRQPLYAVPMVFYVSPNQQHLIEQALAPAVASSSEPTRAAKRAAALSDLAEHFSDRQRKDHCDD